MSGRLDTSPLLGLRLQTPRLVLRLADEHELIELAQLAETGIHAPELMPFLVPWTDRAGSPGFVESFVEFHLALRRDWRPQAWSLDLAAWLDGRPIGMQGIDAKDFGASRTVSTGSWLPLSLQGRGYGTEMRSAVLELAFRGLDARTAESGAIDGNLASARVSEKLGYVAAGEGLVAPRGVDVRMRTFALTRQRWESAAHLRVDIVGLEPCRPLFGV